MIDGYSKDKYNDKIYVTNGCSNHSKTEREGNDYYATPPYALKKLLDVIDFPLPKKIWEPCVGGEHLSRVLENRGYDVRKSDIINYTGNKDIEILDFLSCKETNVDRTIITNPPYKFAYEMTNKMLNVIAEGQYVIQFLKISFLEGQKRRELFDRKCLKYVYISSSRITCALNGDYDRYKESAVGYAWYVWKKGYHGDPIIRWFN